MSKGDTVMFNALRYYISQSFENIFKNKLMVFISITTILFSMILLGIAIIFGTNLNYISSQLEAQFEVHAFVELEYTEEQARALQTDIDAISGIRSATFSTKEEALESLRGMMDSDEALTGLEEDNPLKFSYKITLSDISKAAQVETELNKIEGISSVSNRTDILNGITTFTGVAGNVSLFAMLVFAIISVFIISNTIKLALMSRKREIAIMKSVGATNAFIRNPFVIEGIVVGFIGGVIAFVPIYFGYNAIVSWWSNLLGFFNLIPAEDISVILLAVFVLSGSLLGAIGSTLSVRKYLHTD